MDVRQIASFVRVVELGSFSRASLMLNVTQPSLSKQVRALELELRQTLLMRNGRGVAPTEAGAKLLTHGRAMLTLLERIREDLGPGDGQLAGQVSVGLPPSVARVLTLPLVRQVRQAWPHATLAVSEGLSTQMQLQLLTGQLDMALLYNLAPNPDLEVLPLLDEALYWVHRSTGAGSADPLPLSQLAQCRLVMPKRPNAIRMLIEGVLAHVGLKAQVALEIDGVSAILDLVRDGEGGAVLPASALLSPPPGLVVRRVQGVVARLVLATPARRALSPTQNAVRGALTSLVLQRQGQVGRLGGIAASPAAA